MSSRGTRSRTRSATSSAVAGASCKPARLWPEATITFRSRAPDRYRACYRCFQAADPPTSLRPRRRAIPGRGERPDRAGLRVTRGARCRVEPHVFLGGSDQDPAIVAWHQVVLAVLDDAADQGPLASQQHDLSLKGRGRRVDPDRLQQQPRPGSRRHHDRAARQIANAGPDGRHPATANPEALDAVPRHEPHPAPGCRGQQRRKSQGLRTCARSGK